MYADEIIVIRPAVRDGSGISGAKREEFKMKTRKVGIIGLGHVGAHVLSALVPQAIADEIVLIDINRAKAGANAGISGIPSSICRTVSGHCR